MRKYIVVSLALVGIVGSMAWSADADAAMMHGQHSAFGRFANRCTFSHRLSDDPIVKPGQPGASHSHDFFGNSTTDAFSTATSLRAASDGCTQPGDSAAYWVPTASIDGTDISPKNASAYYLSGRKRGTISAFPPGLQMIAGDSKARTPQSDSVTFWDCSEHSGVPISSLPHACPAGMFVHQIILFPDCWNGVDLDSADHKSHMAYGIRGVCPSGYPVAVPKIMIVVRYPVQDGRGIELSSGSPFSGHADFVNSWKQASLVAVIDRCINGHIVCDNGATGHSMAHRRRRVMHHKH